MAGRLGRSPQMRSPARFEEAYRELSRIGSGSMNDEAVARIKQALKGSTSLLTARAAQIVGGRGLEALVPDLLATFDRLLPGGAKADKGCEAKAAIAKALNKLEHLDDSVFLKGAYHRQMEPAFGGFVDAAVELRCQCAFGLARIGRGDSPCVLADLLVDPERAVRSATARALGTLATPEAEVMLRMRVLTDDPEPEVAAECFNSLIAMSPERSLDFVARYVSTKDLALAEYAALAIGQSKTPEAFGVLLRRWEDDLSPNLRRLLLLPIALVRSDEAFEFLLGIVGHSDARVAAEAVAALGIYTDETSIGRIREVVKNRGDRAVNANFEKQFGPLER